MKNRDIALVVLAAVVIVIAMACATTLAVMSDTEDTRTAAFATLAAGITAGSFALGRLSGANGERDQP